MASRTGEVLDVVRSVGCLPACQPTADMVPGYLGDVDDLPVMLRRPEEHEALALRAGAGEVFDVEGTIRCLPRRHRPWIFRPVMEETLMTLGSMIWGCPTLC